MNHPLLRGILLFLLLRNQQPVLQILQLVPSVLEEMDSLRRMGLLRRLSDGVVEHCIHALLGGCIDHAYLQELGSQRALMFEVIFRHKLGHLQTQ